MSHMKNAARLLAGHRRAALAIVGITLGSLIATIATSAASDLTGAGQELMLYAEANDAGALIEGNDVRMFGVKVGVVEDLAVVDNRTARVTLALETSETPIHEDASLRIRPVSLLGERYVELTPGSPASPVVEDGFTLPADQFSRAVDLDEVLDAVDQPTGKALSLLLTTMGQGLAGNGDSAAEAIDELAPSMQEADQLIEVLDQQTDTLQQLIDGFGPVAKALGANGGGTTDALLDSAAKLLSATGDQREALEQTLGELPSTLRTAQGTLDRLSALSDETIPALRSVRPFTSQLNEIAAEAIDFADAASPAITTLKPVLSEARRLVQEATPLVAQLSSSSAAMEADAANGSRFMLDLTDHLGGLLDFVTYWSLTTNAKDGLSHYFRVQLTNQPDTVTSLDPTGTLPEVLPNEPALPELPDLPGIVDSIPSVPDVLSGLPGLNLGGKGGKGGLLGKRQADAKDSATGLSIAQEQSLFSMLTGGNS